jgi:uncharacterized protein (TIGR03437 family)
MKRFTGVLALAALSFSAALGQTLDSSGNGLLKGVYHFRQLQASSLDPSTGDVTEAVAVSGTITFDGAGHYTAAATSIDNTVSGGAPQTVNVATGAYTIGSGGFGYIANPLDSSDFVYGAVGQGVFVGSSTEGSVENTFIAIPAGPAPTPGSFIGPYWAGVIDFPGGSSANLKNALFPLAPSGRGTFGTITLTGQAENQNTPVITQTVNGATYTFPGDGSISINVPAPSGVSSDDALFCGAKTIFLSADGNFILGYTPNGYDVIFGVKALTSSATNSIYAGLYYMSAFEDAPGSGNSCGDVDSFYGSLISDGNGNQVIHERLAAPLCASIDFETDDQTTFSSNGNAADFNGYDYAFGDGGQAFVAIGTGGFFTLVAGVHTDNIVGTGVFLSPTGVFNAASYAPITASVAPGEFVALFGSGLASSPQMAPAGRPLPTTLNGVQVLVNGTLAPISYVGPTQINAILPYSISSAGIASIQVNNNDVKSNPVTLFTSDSMPGVFSQTQNGLGLAAAVHAATGKSVTPDNPAVAGEYLEVFLSGLGTVTPPVNDGALGPTNPLSYADVYKEGVLAAYFNDYTQQAFPEATLNYAGLAPTLAGLYQMNVQVPVGVGPGNVYLEIVTDSADVNQIQVPVGSSSSKGAVPAQVHTRVLQTHGRPLAALKRAPKNLSRAKAIERNQSPR